MNRALEKRLEAVELRVDAMSRRADAGQVPEWLHWLTCRELDELEVIFHVADVANATELDERSHHRVWAIYSAASVRMLEAPPEVRADPAAVHAYVREIEDRDRPRWGSPAHPDEYAVR